MQQQFPFQPRGDAASTTSIAVTATAQSLTLPTVPVEGGSVRLINAGSQTIHIAFKGTATISGSMPMLSNTIEIFSIPGGSITLSVISAATGSTLFVTVGDGI